MSDSFVYGFAFGVVVTWIAILFALYQHGGWANIRAVFAEQRAHRMHHRKEALERLEKAKQSLKTGKTQ